MWALRILEVVALIVGALYAGLSLVALLARLTSQHRGKWVPGLLLLMVPGISHAAPSISGTSGTITHGSSMTISGSSFGSKGGTNSNKPLIWADFESDFNPSSLGHITAFSGNNNLSRNVGGTQYGLSGANAIGTRSTGVRAFSFILDTHTFTTVYMTGKRRWSAVNSSNMKVFRIWNDNASSMAASTVLDGVAYDEDCTTQDNRFQSFTLTANVWRMEEFQWKKSTANAGDLTSGNGTYRWTANGSVLQEHDGTLCSELAANYGLGNGMEIIDTFDTNDELANGTNIWFDDLYVDNTWAHVIVGNASTLAASTVREVQIPSAWSDTSITVTVNRGGFGESGTAYLYVVDSNNVVSAGHALTFGSGGGGGGSRGVGGSLVILVEWAPLVLGLTWHFRAYLVSALVMMGGAALSTVHTTKTIAHQSTTHLVQGTAHLLKKVSRWH
jgi:hypothetical protein